MFLSIRVLHVLGAALWLGSVTFISIFMMPALQQAGPAAGPILAGMQRRGLVAFMSSISGLTILSGFYLYWRFTGGFSAEVSRTTAAMVFGTGGVLGLAAGIIGASVVGRSAKKATELGERAAKMPEGSERAALVSQIQHHRARMVTFGSIVVALLVVTIALMAIGHYV